MSVGALVHDCLLHADQLGTAVAAASNHVFSLFGVIARKT